MKFTLNAIVLSLTLVLVACDQAPTTPTDSKASASSTTPSPTTGTTSAPSTETPKAENYVVVSQPSYPPFAMLDEKGKVIGMDIDILKAIGEKQNIGFTFLSHDMKGLLETVNTKQADIVATGVNITPERMAQYDFSEPYLEASWVALLDSTKGEKLNSFSDLKDKPIATQGASLSETQLASTKITNQIVPVKTVYLGLAAVQQKKAVAVYDIDAVLNTYLKDNKNLYTVVDEKSGKIPFGFVYKKGNTQLKTKIDAGLEMIKKDGTFDKIYQKWFGNIVTTTASHSTTAVTTPVASASK